MQDWCNTYKKIRKTTPRNKKHNAQQTHCKQSAHYNTPNQSTKGRKTDSNTLQETQQDTNEGQEGNLKEGKCVVSKDLKHRNTEIL